MPDTEAAVQTHYNEMSSISQTAREGMLGIGLFFLLLLLMIVAGGTVSQEMATGSIKSLIIAPVRRWKIFVAKLIAVLTLAAAGGLITWGLSLLVDGIFFGFSTQPAYVFAVGGTAHSMPFLLFFLARTGVELIPVLVYAFFALLLSTVTRNTAVAVGLSMATYFVGNIAYAFVAQLTQDEWVRFLPFANLSLTSRIFPTLSGASLTGVLSGASITDAAGVTGSLAFSACYLAVLCFLMLYTAFDSFTRRDIG